jgi:hypothetical protein
MLYADGQSFVIGMSGLNTRRLNLFVRFASFVLEEFYNNKTAQSSCIRTSSKRNQSPVGSVAAMDDLSGNRDAS